MTFYHPFLVLHYNYNGEIGQKWDLVITFDSGVLLTQGQHIWTAFCKIFSGILQFFLCAQICAKIWSNVPNGGKPSPGVYEQVWPCRQNGGTGGLGKHPDRRRKIVAALIEDLENYKRSIWTLLQGAHSCPNKIVYCTIFSNSVQNFLIVYSIGMYD